jgi:antitoxin ParD1/3/4
MAKVIKRTFSLPPEQGDYIDAKLATGTYSSGSEVVREGLRALMERDAVIEKWLHEEVMPTLKRYEANPESGIPIDEAFERVRAKLLNRTHAAE